MRWTNNLLAYFQSFTTFNFRGQWLWLIFFGACNSWLVNKLVRFFRLLHLRICFLESCYPNEPFQFFWLDCESGKILGSHKLQLIFTTIRIECIIWLRPRFFGGHLICIFFKYLNFLLFLRINYLNDSYLLTLKYCLGGLLDFLVCNFLRNFSWLFTFFGEHPLRFDSFDWRKVGNNIYWAN